MLSVGGAHPVLPLDGTETRADTSRRGDAAATPPRRRRDAAATPPRRRRDAVARLDSPRPQVLVLGTSDGVFNIVLNSVAITFILHLDNSVDIDLPDHNFFRLATPSQLLRHAERWADARKIFRCFLDVARDRSSKDFLVYRGIVGGFRFIIGFAVFLCALAIQNSVTSRARFVVFRRLVSFRRADIFLMNRGDAAAATRRFPGDRRTPQVSR